MHQVIAERPRSCRFRVRVDFTTSSPKSPSLNAAESPLKIMASAVKVSPDASVMPVARPLVQLIFRTGL